MSRVRWVIMAAFIASVSCQPEAATSSDSPGILALSVEEATSSVAPAEIWRARITGNGVDITLDGIPGQAATVDPGTYIVSVEGLLQEGVVSFGERSGVVVAAGSRTSVSIPVTSFIPEGVGAPEDAIAGESFTVSWSPVAWASMGYEVESSPEPTFSQGVDRMTAMQASVTMTRFQPGSYYVRVRVRPTGRTATPGYWSTTAEGTVVKAEDPPRILLDQSFLTFSAQAGAEDPAPGTVVVTNGGGGTLTGLSCGPISYAGDQAAGWLDCSVEPGAAATTLTLSPALVSLSGGTYTATVPVVLDSASNSPQTVSVALSITAAPVLPSIELADTTLVFSATAGGASPGPQTVAILNGGGGTLEDLMCGTISYGSGQPAGWLNCSLNASTAPATLSLRPTPGSLPAGTYSASVPIVSAVASNSPQNVTVTFALEAQPLTPFIHLSATSRVFTAQAGGDSPDPQFITVSNGGGGTLSGLACGPISYGAGQPSDWLTCSLSSSTGLATLALTPSTTVLPAGAYTASVPVLSSSASNSPRSVAVTLQIQQMHTLRVVSNSGVGRVVSHPQGIDRARELGLWDTSSAQFPEGSVVRLEVVDSVGYTSPTLRDWNECLGGPSCTLTMTQDRTVIASAAWRGRGVCWVLRGAGSFAITNTDGVIPGTQMLPPGTWADYDPCSSPGRPVLHLIRASAPVNATYLHTAVPDRGWRLQGWNEACSHNELECIFKVNPDGPFRVLASFEPLPTDQHPVEELWPRFAGPISLAITATAGGQASSASADFNPAPRLSIHPVYVPDADSPFGRYASWLTISVEELEASGRVILTASPSGLAPGVYHTTAHLYSHKAEDERLEIHVTFTVLAP